jgi:hypothetical protein
MTDAAYSTEGDGDLLRDRRALDWVIAVTTVCTVDPGLP